MRICLVVRALPLHRLGGLEFHTLDLARALHARGHEVHVVTSAAPGNAGGGDGSDTQSDPDGIQIHFLTAGSSGDYSVDFFRGAGRLAAEIIQREKCDVLHSQEFAGMFFRGLKVPHVCTVHGTMFTEVPLDRRYFRRLSTMEKARAVWRYKSRILLHRPFRKLLRDADELLVDSEFSFREVSRMEPGTRAKLNVVPLGMDFGRYPDAVDNFATEGHAPEGDITAPLRIALLGRLQEQKGLRVVFEAARLLRDRSVSFKMNIGGAGDFSSQLHALIGEHRMEDSIILHGRIPEEKTSEFLSANHLFLFPDLTQPAFGLVAVEAMYHGLPVVGARSGAIPEVVTDQTGWLYDAGSAHELAATLQRLAEDRNKIIAKAKASRAHAAHFTADRMAEMTEQVYLKALAREPSTVA